MKTALIFISGILLIIAPARSQPSKLPIDASHSVISFSVGFAGDITSIEGRFNEFSGEVGYTEPGDLTTFFANVSINTSSINTGDKDRDEDLKGDGYFNVTAFPEISFASSSTSKTADGFSLKGTFEMLGISKEMEIKFQLTHDDPVAWVFGEPRIAAKGNLTLSRSEFSIPKRGWDTMIPSLGSMMLNDKVEIRLVIQGVGKGLSGIILEEIAATDVKTGIKKYKQMIKEHEGKDTYSFGASTLARISSKLSQSGKNEDAISLAEFITKEEPKSFLGFYALASAYSASGDKDKAIANYEKVIEMNPKFDRAKKELDALKSN